jgi:sugar lactone lactonase YvrE
VDDRDRLWILDAANPRFEGVVREGGGPKLVHVDLATDSVVSTVRFGPEIAKDGSYLNDVRIDTVDDTAFITDSGVGAIIVADLARGDARRLLDGHPSTQADPEYVPVIGGRDLRFHTADGATGDSPRIHADGIALDQKRQVLYWQALTGNRLHRIDARLLKSRTAEGWQLADSVQDLGPTVVSDGMECDALGNLYFTALEHSAIMMLPDRGREGLRPTRSGTPTNPETRAAPLALRTVLIDERIAWPDSLAIGPEGPPPPGREGGARPGRWLYFTTSRIHQIAPFEAPGTMPEGGTAVWRTWLPGQ